MSGAEILVVESVSNSDDKSLVAECTGGKVAIGGGARILGAAGSREDEIPTSVAIVASYPLGVSGEKSPRWGAIAKNIGTQTEDWRLSVHVVCAVAAD